MNQTYNLSWDLYQESNEEILNKSITVSTSAYNRTFNTGFKLSDFDNIKVEVSGRLNFYARKYTANSFWYKYDALSETNDGGYLTARVDMFNSSQYSTLGPGSATVTEKSSPKSDSYWKNMTVSLPGRTTGTISTDGTNLPIQGSTIMEFPNPISGQLKGQRATMSFGLNHELQLISRHNYDGYYDTDDSAGYFTNLLVT